MATLTEQQKKSLLKAFYQRLHNGGLGAQTRHRALAGELIVLTPPARSTRMAKGLAVAVLIGGVAVALNDTDVGDRPRPIAISLPSEALPCSHLEAMGRVVRCTLDDDAMAALKDRPVDEERAMYASTRAAVVAAGHSDVLVVDSGGRPRSPRAAR
jgi:hypothetical protein